MPKDHEDALRSSTDASWRTSAARTGLDDASAASTWDGFRALSSFRFRLIDLARRRDRPHARPSRAFASLAPRQTSSLCSVEQAEALHELYRRYAIATAVMAIASGWDCARITYPRADEHPFQSEVFGLAGRRAGLAAPQLAEATAMLGEATVRLDALHALLGDQRSPFEALCAEHDLSEIAALLLVLVAAPAIWGELARIYAVVDNDPARPVCDEYLLWQLLEGKLSRRELSRELDPASPLLRHGLVRAEAGRRPFQALAADATVVKLLSGCAVEADLERGVAHVPCRVPLERLVVPSEVIDRALADLAAAPAGAARVIVRGMKGSGRRTLLAAVAQRAGRTLATIDVPTLLRENRLAALAEMLQRAHLRGGLPCLDGLEAIPSEEGAVRAALRDTVRAHHGPLAMRLARHAQPAIDPGYVVIDLPVLTVAERAAQWHAVATRAGMTLAAIDHLAAKFTVGAGTIRKVVADAARAAPDDPDRAIDHTLRQYLETTIADVATRVTRLATWERIVLPAAVADSVAELIARIRHRRTVFDTWGFDKVVSTSRGLVALLQGAPGTGKTLLAGAVANELGLDLYQVDLARVVSRWVGETERNLARIFDAAEHGHAMILFDEADALFARRTDVQTSNDRYANLETDYLLQRLDSFEGIAILTTNASPAIDPAFRRRLTCSITMPFPDAAARERLWRVHLPAQLPRAGELDLGELARRYEMSGGYIRNAALRAAFLAAEDQSPLSRLHLERAIRTELRDQPAASE